MNVTWVRRRSWPAAAVLAGIGVLPTQPGTISLQPNQTQRQTAGAPYQSSLPSINQLDQFLSSPSRASLEGQGLDPSVAAFVNSTVLGSDNAPGSDNALSSGNGPGFGANTIGPAPAIISGAGVQAACEEPAGQFDPPPKYWNSRTVSDIPASLTANSVSAGTDSPNLAPEGRAGAWCRPAPVPFAESSPLVSRAFWQPIAVVTFGVVVFWLSRGIRLPP